MKTISDNSFSMICGITILVFLILFDILFRIYDHYSVTHTPPIPAVSAHINIEPPKYDAITIDFDTLRVSMISRSSEGVTYIRLGKGTIVADAIKEVRLSDKDHEKLVSDFEEWRARAKKAE